MPAAPLAVGCSRRGSPGRTPGEDRQRRAAQLGQQVLESRRCVVVLPTSKQPALDQPPQSLRQDLTGDAEGGGEVVEPPMTAGDLLDDQPRPAVTDDRG